MIVALKRALRQDASVPRTLLTVTFLFLALVLGVAWPFHQTLPAFGEMADTDARKGAFFSYLLPVVQSENARIASLRERVAALGLKYASGAGLGGEERRYLIVLAGFYESPIKAPGHDGFFRELLTRVDEVPASLVLSQAAVESGWGRSRFAREGLNLFGHYCYEPGCGMLPRAHPAGARFEIADFVRVQRSVRLYLRNLNSHPAYERFRQMRAARRADNKPLSGYRLAGALTEYSERGAAYVNDLRLMISANDLETIRKRL